MKKKLDQVEIDELLIRLLSVEDLKVEACSDVSGKFASPFAMSHLLSVLPISPRPEASLQDTTKKRRSSAPPTLAKTARYYALKAMGRIHYFIQD